MVERPGFGESDPHPGRRYLDWPDDLTQVADQLGIGDFVLAGTSGAGPYLHACGVRIAERIRRLGVIACMGPTDISDEMRYWRRATLAMARIAPRLLKASLPRNPEAFYRLLRSLRVTLRRTLHHESHEVANPELVGDLREVVRPVEIAPRDRTETVAP